MMYTQFVVARDYDLAIGVVTRNWRDGEVYRGFSRAVGLSTAAFFDAERVIDSYGKKCALLFDIDRKRDALPRDVVKS